MERLALFAILALALGLRAFNLEHNGWGAEYYSAAVRSMSSSWHNFLYAAFDPVGFISVDKPPLALWVQVASVKLFGYSPSSVLLPQALEGVACVAILHRVVRTCCGSTEALLAALFMAVTPVLVAVNRTNNMDSALLLVLMLAAWALLHAVRTGSRVRLVLAMALVGMAFNVKMLAAFIVLPAFAIVYATCAPIELRKRLVDLAIAGAVLAAVSLSWVATFDLTPAEQRPYAGGSSNNSMLQLTIGHNAASRFVSRGRATRSEPAADTQPSVIAQRLFVREPVGLLRLARGQLAAQAGWLLPFALAAMTLAACTGLLRRRTDPGAQCVILWGCWLATYWLVYSFAGGIVHFYYLSTLAPALAVLAAIGLKQLWDLASGVGRGRRALALLLLVSGLWQWHVDSSGLGWPIDAFAVRGDDWRTWVHAAMAAGVIGAAVALALAPMRGRAIRSGAVTVGVCALLLLPLAWSLSAVLVPGHGVLPSADLYRLDPAVVNSEDPRVRGTFGRSFDVSRLAAFLEANRNGESFALATTTTRIAAPLMVASGLPVMAMGGFHGLDRAETVEQLIEDSRTGEVRFVMLEDAAAASRRLGAEAALAPISAWVRANGRRVDGLRWRSRGLPTELELYDLRPQLGLQRPAVSQPTSRTE